MGPIGTHGHFMGPTGQLPRATSIENKGSTYTAWPIYGSNRGQVMGIVTKDRVFAGGIVGATLVVAQGRHKACPYKGRLGSGAIRGVDGDVVVSEVAGPNP